MKYTQVVHVLGFGGGLFARMVQADWLPRTEEYVLLAHDEGRARVAAVFHTPHCGTLVTMNVPYTDAQADWTPQQRAESLKAMGFEQARPAVEKVVLR